MLPKRFRLKDASLFQKAFRSGKPFFFGDINCKAVFFGDGMTKVGFAISKKLFPKAVDRNAVKRMFADAVHASYESIPDGWHIVFFLRKNTSLDKGEVKKSISEIIRKISGIKTQAL
jgi:ribonuclease P protein component